MTITVTEPCVSPGLCYGVGLGVGVSPIGTIVDNFASPACGTFELRDISTGDGI
jgi:hypothetical protein